MILYQVIRIVIYEKIKQLIDLNNEDVHPIKIKKTIPGKKIKSVELLVRVDADN